MTIPHPHPQPNQETLPIHRDDEDLPAGAATAGGGDAAESGEEAVGFGAEWGSDHGDGELVAVRLDAEDHLYFMRVQFLPEYMRGRILPQYMRGRSHLQYMGECLRFVKGHWHFVEGLLARRRLSLAFAIAVSISY